MGQYIENRPVPCMYCRRQVTGRETPPYRRGNEMVYECRWICANCGQLVRQDERTEPAKD